MGKKSVVISKRRWGVTLSELILWERQRDPWVVRQDHQLIFTKEDGEISVESCEVSVEELEYFPSV